MHSAAFTKADVFNTKNANDSKPKGIPPGRTAGFGPIVAYRLASMRVEDEAGSIGLPLSAKPHITFVESFRYPCPGEARHLAGDPHPCTQIALGRVQVHRTSATHRSERRGHES
jgi:hypothetical protein